MNLLHSFRKTVALCGLLWGAASGLPAAEPVNIVPRPLYVSQTEGCFRLTPKTVIGYDAALKPQAEYLAQKLSASTGWDLTLREGRRRADIVLTLSAADTLKTEGYRLDVGQRRVQIAGRDASGVFYGIQSLLQLFPPQVYSAVRQRQVDWCVPCVAVADAPQHPWRGMMLDVARYFFDKDFVKQYIDYMAAYKLNKLQFHLVDDSGWRIEIKKYPRLTQVGAWAGPDSRRLGGYYTQEDIREIVDYARVRGVEVIPEIEFPAHVLSAIVAYPWLSCTQVQHKVPEQHFISRDLLCVGRESTYRFLADVLAETVKLFPSKYICIGGDEAVYTRWEQCPECQAVMKREGLTKASELQGYLTNVVSDMMKQYDRTIIGWEEIIQRGKLHNPVVALFWHNVNDTIQATQTGHKGILSPCSSLYLDFPESSTPGEVKAATWQPPCSLEKCYATPVGDYSPTSTVLGVQACLWSDQFIHGTQLQEITPLNENRSEQYAEYLTFPRLLAVAELGWTPQARRSYADFSSRMATQYARLDYMGCNYRVPEPRVERISRVDSGVEVALAPSVAGADIRYTTDGSYPTIHSPRYEQPVRVAQQSDFHAITVVSSRHYSLPVYFAPDYSEYKVYGTYTAGWKPLDIQLRPTAWRMDCTGKVAANGSYDITFVQTQGTDSLRLRGLKLYKRDELLAEVKTEDAVRPGHVVTFHVDVDRFEAGTPFTLEVEAWGQPGNNTQGLVFIRKN